MAFRKGISPLIAAVLLIVFTMTIAGFMATWATQLTEGNLGSAETGASCIGALDVSSISFATNQTDKKNDPPDGNVTFRLRNIGNDIELSGLTADLIYADSSKSSAHSNIDLSDYGATDPLTEGTTTWIIYNTSDLEKPQTLSVWSSNCPEYVVDEKVR